MEASTDETSQTEKHLVKKVGVDSIFRNTLEEVFFWRYYWLRLVYGRGHYQIAIYIDFIVRTYILKMFEFECISDGKSEVQRLKEKVAKVLYSRYKSVDKTWQELHGDEVAFNQATPKKQHDVKRASAIRTMPQPPFNPPCLIRYPYCPPVPWEPPHPESPMRHIVDVETCLRFYLNVNADFADAGDVPGSTSAVVANDPPGAADDCNADHVADPPGDDEETHKALPENDQDVGDV